ncbi:MAG: three-Cys-motif partner protein TcmP [Elusimicrobiota bacterium]|jgi:three-Cys-motif partner protein|nr:three-Cys-motif partner protein TcmP [Elusimicrobiota bacterium]
MARRKNIEVTPDKVSPHTIKKFELIEKYVKDWAPKLLNYPNCKGIVFIDCMCNSGIYNDYLDKKVVGTPIRVAAYLADTMKTYPNKQAHLYFNDLSAEKIEVLKTRLPADANNFHITTRIGDGNDLLKTIRATNISHTHYLLVYDPNQASIDWVALSPFLRNWGEVIINHMVSDSIRGVSQAKSDATKAKYAQTYGAPVESLLTFRGKRDAYEKRIQKIITMLSTQTGKRYIAPFPFFNKKNSLVYNLIHCSGHIAGFKLFKKTAWKTFGGKSSTKNTYGNEKQPELDFNGTGELNTMTDEYCYYVKDIAKFIHDSFIGQQNVSLSEVWRLLDDHPTFPSDGYKPEIKKELKDIYRDIVSKKSITFTKRRA